MRKLTCLVLLLAGCAAPESISPRDLDESDRRFHPASAPDPKARTEEILKKEELGLSDVLEIADLLNPQLSSERKNIDLAAATIWEAKLYPNPSAVFEVEDFRTGGGTGWSQSTRTGGLRVPIVVSGRIGAATTLAEKEREIAAIHYLWRRREILSDVKRAFVAVLASKRNLELARETRDIAKSLHHATDERFKAQAVPEMELLKAAVNLAKAEAELKRSEQHLAIAVKALHAQMGDVDFPNEKFTGALTTRFTLPSFEALRGLVTASHLLMEEAARTKEAAALRLSLVKSERWPDLGLEVRGGIGTEGESLLEGGLEIPLPVFSRNQGKIMAAEIRLRQAELQIQAVRNDLLFRLTEAYRNLVASQDRVTIYAEEILPKAQKALEQTNEGYRLSKFGYLDLLDAQRTLAEAHTAFAAALEDLNLAAGELEKLTGTKLESIR